MTEAIKSSATEIQEATSAAVQQKLRRRQKKQRSLSSRRDDLHLNTQIHQVMVQGMQVSLPWLSFMARRDG
jgi:hypothetical protein